MSVRKWYLAAIVFAVSLAAPAPTPAHAQVNSGISASGAAEISRPATQMRMQVIVPAEGKTTADALDALQARRDVLKAQLLQLGAAADSIRFTDPRMLSDLNEPIRQLEQFIQPRMGAKAPPRPERPIQVVLTATAEWPLAEGSPEQQLTRSEDLRHRIEQITRVSSQPSGVGAGASAGSAGGAGELPPRIDYGDGMPEPGEPVIVYVAKFPAEQRTQAMATALEGARAQAAQLAQAANVQLGPLQALSQSASPIYARFGFRSGMSAVLYQMMESMGSDEMGGVLNADEVIGPEPSTIKLEIVVNATWGIR